MQSRRYLQSLDHVYVPISYMRCTYYNPVRGCSSSISRTPDTQYLTRIKHLFLSHVRESIVPETHV